MLVGEPGVLGANGRIVEARGNGMRRGDLAVLVLQNVGVGTLEDARARAHKTLVRGEARGVLAKLSAAAAGLDANHFHIGVGQELVKQADGIRAAANAGEQMRGQALLSSKDL